jgi:hypothetical protein
MTEPQSMEANATSRTEFERGLGWVRVGWHMFQQDSAFWLSVSLMYLTVVALLGVLPFAGFLLAVMLTPMMLAGVLLGLQQGIDLAPGASAFHRYVAAPVRLLTRAFVNESHVYAIVLLGIVSLGLVMLVRIAEYLLGVGALGNLFSTSAGAAVSWPWRLIGGLLVLLLNVALFMALFYAVHRTVLGGRDVMQAIHESFGASRRYALSHLVYLLGFGTAYAAMGAAFSVSMALGYLVWFALGAMLVPVFLHASYRSYHESF